MFILWRSFFQLLPVPPSSIFHPLTSAPSAEALVCVCVCCLLNRFVLLHVIFIHLLYTFWAIAAAAAWYKCCCLSIYLFVCVCLKRLHRAESALTTLLQAHAVGFCIAILVLSCTSHSSSSIHSWSISNWTTLLLPLRELKTTNIGHAPAAAAAFNALHQQQLKQMRRASASASARFAS